MDDTEVLRRTMVQAINSGDNTRATLEEKYGKVWDTEQMQAEFQALGFAAPFIIVQERATGKKGSLMFAHSPRFYFSFTPS